MVELRAAVVLGAGSISFEMLRYLTERLPFMVCPRWVRTAIQPIALSDVIRYLIRALAVEPGIYEIGGADVTSYRKMIAAYAAVRGLRVRPILDVPYLTPRLSSYWLDLVTPVDRHVSHALIESLATEDAIGSVERYFRFGDVALPFPEVYPDDAIRSDRVRAFAERCFSTCTCSTCSRRARHNPAPSINCRTASRPISMPCFLARYSLASVGPNPWYTSCASTRVAASRVSWLNLRFEPRPRNPCSTALSPSFFSFLNIRRTCRSLTSISVAACRRVINLLAAFFSTTRRSRSRWVIVRTPGSSTPPA